MAKIKSFNPFKMWGAWVGFALVFIVVFIANLPFLSELSDPLGSLCNFWDLFA